MALKRSTSKTKCLASSTVDPGIFLNFDTGSNEQKEHGVYHYGSILFSVLIIISTFLMLKKKML